MAIHDEVVTNPKSTSRCPACRTLFKPYELFYKDNLSAQEQTLILNSAKAWILVHDEDAPPQTYDLIEGLNSCGRNPENSGADISKLGNIIKIDTKDGTMSRNHFSIIVLKSGAKWSFVIKDNKSLNKTYIDTKRIDDFTREMRKLLPSEEIYLDDGAIIQAGKTKIHFKLADSINSRDAVSKVIHGQKFTKTVIL